MRFGMHFAEESVSGDGGRGSGRGPVPRFRERRIELSNGPRPSAASPPHHSSEIQNGLTECIIVGRRNICYCRPLMFYDALKYMYVKLVCST